MTEEKIMQMATRRVVLHFVWAFTALFAIVLLLVWCSR